jgi:hypothetical protein
MPQYEYRFTSSTGLIQLVSTQEVADDSAAKASAQTVFATFLDFPTLEVWRQAGRDIAPARGPRCAIREPLRFLPG